MKKSIIESVCDQCEKHYKLGEKHGVIIGLLIGIVLGVIILTTYIYFQTSLR